jgi:hypothetical protein
MWWERTSQGASPQVLQLRVGSRGAAATSISASYHSLPQARRLVSSGEIASAHP